MIKFFRNLSAGEAGIRQKLFDTMKSSMTQGDTQRYDYQQSEIPCDHQKQIITI